MYFNDMFGDGKSEPTSLDLRVTGVRSALERLTNSREIFLRNAKALILHYDFHQPTCIALLCVS